MIKLVIASAPGKVILVGEHFVVEYEPAVVAAVNLRAKVEATLREDELTIIESLDLKKRVTLARGEECKDFQLKPIHKIVEEITKLTGEWKGINVRISSEIPIAAGMGSSAAVAVAATLAISKAFGLELSKDEISEIAYKAEEIVHGKPSGIDNTISTYGGVIAYRRGEGFVPIECDFSGYKLILADSGIPRSTGEMVAKVRALRSRYPKVMEPLYHSAGRLAIEAAKAIREGDFVKLGELMNINHGLLSAIGVSNEKLEIMVYTARKAGALGAKITGAGGGGCIVALVEDGKVEKVAEALKKVSKKIYVLEVSMEGVRLESS